MCAARRKLCGKGMKAPARQGTAGARSQIYEKGIEPGGKEMAFKRLIIEIGQGVDMHGGDQNNAVKKATADAVHHCCMAGISEIFELTDRKTQAKVRADIYAPHPEEVDPQVVKDYLTMWEVETFVHHGGADPEGISLDGDEKTAITVALVVLTVSVDC